MLEKEIIKKYDTSTNWLIIDDNKKWNHSQVHERVNGIVNGDLHDFFDLAVDNTLFQQLKTKYDCIFIGEIFHVLEYQTIVNNLISAGQALNNNGKIIISLTEEIKEHVVNVSKLISRIKLLENYQVDESFRYCDEDEINWTLIVVSVYTSEDFSYQDQIKIGEKITSLVNNGKNLGKIKKGYLLSICDLQQEPFKAAYTSNQELMSIYLQNLIIELKPSLNCEFLIKLSELVYINRKAILSLTKFNNLIEGTFTLALDDYTNQTIIQDKQYVAQFAALYQTVFNKSLKSKLSTETLEKINKLGDSYVTK